MSERNSRSGPSGHDTESEAGPHEVYEAPRLSEWGSIGQFTAGGAGLANDGADSASGGGGYEIEQ